MADGSTQSMAEILKRRRQVGFVGREAQLARFRDNLALPVDDERRRFLFSVHGVGGVGKTFLLGHLRRVAAEAGWATALAGDDVFDVPETLAALAGQLGEQGVRLKRFGQRYAGYLRRATAPEESGHAPGEGPASLVTQTAVRMSLGAARSLPGGGLIADAVNADDVARQVDHMRMAAKERLRHHDTRLSSPAEELTKAFVEGLGQADRPVALFFDTYERTAVFLDVWLRSVFERLPPNLVVTVAGRHPLDSSLWSGYLSVLEELPLSVFTDVEARQLLAQVAVTDEPVVNAIVQASGGLPLAVAMHAANRPAAPSAMADVTGSLVERFLQWENNPVMRDIALEAALPRRLDRDTLAAVLDPDTDPDDAYLWLSRQAFVTRDEGRLRYHDIVREAMLRLARTYSVSRWRERHDRVAESHRRLREGLGHDPGDGWAHAEWQSAMLEETYHRLCADPAGVLPQALHGAVSACVESLALAARWADTLAEAGHDADNETVETLGERLAEALRADTDGAVAYLDILLRHPRFPEAARAEAYEERGRRNRLATDYRQAVADYGHALALAPETGSALAGRGEAHRMLGRNDEALADLTRAIELEPADDWALGSRGQTYQRMERFDEALADLGHAIEINPDYSWAFAERGRTYRLMGRYTEAFADLDRAIELDPAYTWAIAERGETYQELNRYDEALADLTHVIGIDPDYAWAFAERGQTHRLMNRHGEALADLTRAVELDPAYAWAFAERGQTYRQLGRYDEALADLGHAIELDPAYTWAIAERGETYQELNRYDEALADLTRAIEINPDYAWAIGTRGQTYGQLGRYDEALTDLTRAIGLASGHAWMFAERGHAHRMTQRHDEALADLDRAIELDPDEAEIFAERARTHRTLGRIAEALADFDRAIELDPDESAYAAERAELAEQRPWTG